MFDFYAAIYASQIFPNLMDHNSIEIKAMSMSLNSEYKINLCEFSLPQLESWFEKELGEPRFRARQVWQWIWQKMARDFTSMSNVSKSLRTRLGECAEICWPEIAGMQTASDGTVKFLLKFSDGCSAETVLIPAPNRNGEIRWSQCLSTQIGCPMACAFCATGRMGFSRNMTMGEILGQILVGRHYLQDDRPDRPIIRNLVFMGMGEPLLNIQSLLLSLESLSDDKGLNYSPRRITVSTCGIEKGLQILGESGLAYLALSLHAPNQELREQIMPKAAQWKLEDMFQALKKYPLKTRERITFEYLLLGGVNDSLEHARQLARLVSSVKGKINLIPFNPVKGIPFKAPDMDKVEEFQKYLCNKNITAILRKSRGADISAACGQLKTERSI